MGWTTPTTRSANELVTADIWNTDLVDNLDYLNNRPSDEYTADEVSDYTTTSTTFVDVDATNFSLTIETNGGDVRVGFRGNVAYASQNLEVYFDVVVDGTPVGGDDGLNGQRVTLGLAPGFNVSFDAYITGLSAGSHTFKLQWKVSRDTAILYAGAGTSGGDVHPQFWVKEV